MKVKNLQIGSGKPKICVPITAKSAAEALREAENLVKYEKKSIDLVEFRIDYLSGVKEKAAYAEALSCVHSALGEIPLLCTFRTQAEGGEKAVTEAEYEEILSCCLESGTVDFIDVEIERSEALFQRIRKKAAGKQVCLIASNHDFTKTPSGDEMLRMLLKMERAGADIAKIAVMPESREDVLTLLKTSSDAKACMKIPFIAISMGKMGGLSRIAGETFGSCITFGTVGSASAPGQIDAGMLREVLEIL